MIYFLTYPFVFTIFRILARVLGRVRSSGEENVPPTGGFIYCPNHQSDSDPPILFVTAPRRAWFIGKQELFDVPVIGWFWYRFHAFPIKRDSADRAALRRAEACLRRGDPIVIFPEGRCSPSGKLAPLQPGAAMLSLRTGAPIVPVGIENTQMLLPYHEFAPRFAEKPVTVTFGVPIDPRDFTQRGKSAATNALTVKLGEELARLTHQSPPLQPAPAVPA